MDEVKGGTSKEIYTRDCGSVTVEDRTAAVMIFSARDDVTRIDTCHCVVKWLPGRSRFKKSEYVDRVKLCKVDKTV